MQRFTEDESALDEGALRAARPAVSYGGNGKTFFGSFETEYPGHVHQEAAWQRLASDREAASTLVATGTGSGKTECFLVPAA